MSKNASRIIRRFSTHFAYTLQALLKACFFVR
nr:MAG TPA: hypothetical protein [Caudoviricetes sp.]